MKLGPLLSRLRARLQHYGLPWCDSEPPEVLAQRLYDNGYWDEFSWDFRMLYDPRTRTLYDFSD